MDHTLFVEGVMREFYEDAHLQCEHCGQHIANPEDENEVLGATIIDGEMGWAEVAWACGYCRNTNQVTYDHDREG